MNHTPTQILVGFYMADCGGPYIFGMGDRAWLESVKPHNIVGDIITRPATLAEIAADDRDDAWHSERALRMAEGWE